MDGSLSYSGRDSEAGSVFSSWRCDGVKSTTGGSAIRRIMDLSFSGKGVGSFRRVYLSHWGGTGRRSGVLWEGRSGFALCRVMRRSRGEFIDDDFGTDQISTCESFISGWICFSESFDSLILAMQRSVRSMTLLHLIIAWQDGIMSSEYYYERVLMGAESGNLSLAASRVEIGDK